MSTTLKLKRIQVMTACKSLAILLEAPYHLIHTPKLVLALDRLEPTLQTVNKARQKLIASYAQMVEGDPEKGEKPTPLLDDKGDVEFETPAQRGQCTAALQDFDEEEIEIAGFPLDAVKMHNKELKASGAHAYVLRFMVDSQPVVAPAKKAAKA